VQVTLRTSGNEARSCMSVSTAHAGAIGHHSRIGNLKVVGTWKDEHESQRSSAAYESAALTKLRRSALIGTFQHIVESNRSPVCNKALIENVYSDILNVSMHSGLRRIWALAERICNFTQLSL
jgi:hypothetical protein